VSGASWASENLDHRPPAGCSERCSPRRRQVTRALARMVYRRGDHHHPRLSLRNGAAMYPYPSRAHRAVPHIRVRHHRRHSFGFFSFLSASVTVAPIEVFVRLMQYGSLLLAGFDTSPRTSPGSARG